MKSQVARMWRRESGVETPEIELLPGQGHHVFRHAGRLFWMSRHAERMMQQGWDSTPFQYESMTLSCLGRSRGPLEALLGEAERVAGMEDKDRTHVFVLHEYGYRWVKALSKAPRPFESVCLDSSVSDDLVCPARGAGVRHVCGPSARGTGLLDLCICVCMCVCARARACIRRSCVSERAQVRDATEFFGAEDWYRRRGIPYRRGYLLHGPPGCGKTSFVCALAARLKLHICVLNLSARRMDDSKLNARMHETPRDAIVLLEDVVRGSVAVLGECARAWLECVVRWCGAVTVWTNARTRCPMYADPNADRGDTRWRAGRGLRRARGGGRGGRLRGHVQRPPERDRRRRGAGACV